MWGCNVGAEVHPDEGTGRLRSTLTLHDLGIGPGRRLAQGVVVLLRLIALAAAAAVALGGCTGTLTTSSSSMATPVVSAGSPSATSIPVVSPAGGPPIVMGTVTAGPVCPVERSSPDPRCAPRPVAGAVILVTDASGQEVGRATSGADGSYQLYVKETGALLITAQPVAGLVRAPAPVSVTLASPGQVERIDLQYDTGIR